MDNRPIGVFDSGIGGISVLNECVKFMPNENYVFFADSKNAPYGDKDFECIKKMTINTINKFFIKKNIKALVIACNTVTNTCVRDLREKYNFPIIGIEPAIKPAIKFSDKKVLVLATKATIESKKFHNLMLAYGTDKVIPVPCSGLVQLIESKENEATILNYLDKTLTNIDIDEISSVVLGCTHYNFVEDILYKYFKNNIQIFHGNLGVANNLKNTLCSNNIESNSNIGSISLNSSSGEDYNIKLRQFIRSCV